MPALESLLERLVQHRIDFVVVGGFAAVAHGASLLTQDLDICCPFTKEHLLRLQQALSDLHPFHRLTPARIPLALTHDNLTDLKNLYLMTTWGQLDCLSTIKGVGDFAAVHAHSIEIPLPFGSCRVLNLEALIQAKQAIGETRDKLTIIQLKAIQARLRSGNT
jgi:hypothetical protein